MSRKRIPIMLFASVVIAAIALLTVLMVNSSASHAIPSGMPTSLKPDQYFPLRIGNRWVYSWTNNVYATLPIIETIVINKQVSSLYRMHAYHSKAQGQFEIITTTAGYEWGGWGSGGFNPFPLPMYLIPYYLKVPENFLPASFQVGDTWSGTGLYGGTEYTGTTTVVTNTATVSVSGRIYTNCLQLRTIITGPHSFGAGTRDAWFAPDVGLVKFVYNHNDGSVTRAELLMGPYAYAVYLPLTLKNYDPLLVYFDDFSDPGSGWYIGEEPDQTKWSYQSGEYEILLYKTFSGGFASAPVSSPANYSVEADMRCHIGITTCIYGLLFGLVDWDHFYLFTVDPDARTYSVWRRDGSNWVNLVNWTPSNFINSLGAPNRLIVMRSGSQITVYVNGHLLASTNDSTYTGSLGVGLYAGSWESAPVAVRFDNFKIWRLVSPMSVNEIPSPPEVKSIGLGVGLVERP